MSVLDKRNAAVEKQPVEKHYERRWLEAKSEILSGAGPVVDFFINMHKQCEVVADKHNVNPAKLRTWFLNELPITELNEGDFDDSEDEEANYDEED